MNSCSLPLNVSSLPSDSLTGCWTVWTTDVQLMVASIVQHITQEMMDPVSSPPFVQQGVVEISKHGVLLVLRCRQHLPKLPTHPSIITTQTLCAHKCLQTVKKTHRTHYGGVTPSMVARP